MTVKYQIFVSSTFEDLKDERRGVIEAILNLGHIPVGMELFQANDDTQWNYIKRRISECDYYVLIVAERYGSELDGKSYTQMELEYAMEQGIPVVSFLLSSEARKTWPQDRVEFANKDKIDALRTLCQNKLIKYWKNGDELALRVTQTLFEMTRDTPRTGWVRADSVPSPHVLEELTKLSEEKRQLQEKLAAFEQTETLKVPADVVHRIGELEMTFLNQYFEGYEAEDDIPCLLDVFLNIHKMLAAGAENYQIGQAILKHYPKTEMDYFNTIEFMNEICSHNLADSSNIVVGDRQKAIYRLTTYGKDFVMYAYNYAAQRSANNSTS